MRSLFTHTPEDDVRLLYTLEDAGLKLNPDKHLLRQKRLNYIWHCFDENGILPDDAKIQAVTQPEPASNLTDLSSVLGMILYLGRYLPGLADVTKPLNELLKSDAAVQEEAFRKLKQLILFWHFMTWQSLS